MTKEDRIKALEKIAQSNDERRAFLEGAAKAHGEYAKSRDESADSLSDWGTMVGVGGGTAGGAMTLKGVKDMLSKGPSVAPAGLKYVYSPVKPYSLEKIVPTGALSATEPRFSAIVPRPKVNPKLQGKRLALKGGLLGLGSLGVSSALHGMADSNREKANAHRKSLDEIKSEIR